MKIFKGQLTDTYVGTLTEPDFNKVVGGNYITTYTSPAKIREGGVTKIRTKPMDMSQIMTVGQNRKVSFWSHINGSNQVQSTGSGSSIYIAYQVAPAASGLSWYTVAGRLRTGGTSISGTSGTHVSNIATPITMPWWRLEFCMLTTHSTADMTVDYALVAE